MLIKCVDILFVDGHNEELLTGIESSLDILATTLHFTEADVVALHCQDLQFADLRLGFATCNGLHHKDAHVEPDERTLAATEVDVNFLLLVFLDCGAFEDVSF